MMDGYSVLAVRGMPQIRPGDDLARLITEAAPACALRVRFSIKCDANDRQATALSAAM